MGRVSLGRFSYGSIKVIGQRCHVYVGDFCSIADCVKVITLGHNPNSISTFPFNKKNWELAFGSKAHPVVYGNVHIGSDVWIGYNTTIMGGVTIGDGAVIAAESMVTKDISPYSIVAGNPAVPIRPRFDYPVVQKLLKIKWWEWTEEKIVDNAHLLCSENINEFIMLHERK